VRERLAAARVVALPVRENSYSGATTTLLQAMAMAKPSSSPAPTQSRPVTAWRTASTAVSFRRAMPAAFEDALLETLTGADAATALGIRARETVERSLSWERYTNALWELSPASRPP
jgi:glycosyltransferase involved in cell wall biosynthesis